MKIIVVDDDSVCLMRVRMTLDALQHKCRFFDNALDAWQAHQDDRADVIISDWQMENMDGADFCRRVRQQVNVPYTYFIMVTATLTSDEDCTKAIAADVDDFLPKPLTREAIWRRLHVARRILTFANHVQQLESLLPICMYCKKIREGEQGGDSSWRPIEDYINVRTGSEFSHGVCPDCHTATAAQWGLRSSKKAA